MEHAHIYFVILFAIVEIIGLGLLATEVRIGHSVEEIQKEHSFLKMMQFLYTTGDYTGAYTLNRLDQGDTPEQAKQWISDLTPESIKKAVEDNWDAERLSKSLMRWDKYTSPAAAKRRRKNLGLGGTLLIAAAIGHVVLEVVAQPRPF